MPVKVETQFSQQVSPLPVLLRERLSERVREGRDGMKVQTEGLVKPNMKTLSSRVISNRCFAVCPSCYFPFNESACGWMLMKNDNRPLKLTHIFPDLCSQTIALHEELTLKPKLAQQALMQHI